MYAGLTEEFLVLKRIPARPVQKKSILTAKNSIRQKLRALRVNITGTSVKAKGFYVVFQGKGKLWHENSCLGKFVVEYSFVDCSVD